LVEANRDGVERLAILSNLAISSERLLAAGGGVRSTAHFDVRIAYGEGLDVSAERAKLAKEIEKLQAAIASKGRQLADETFRSRAPEKIIRGLNETVAAQKIELEKLKNRLAQLG
jgi:valyl-tRNA synthetase